MAQGRMKGKEKSLM